MKKSNAGRAGAHLRTQAEANRPAAEILRNIGSGERITQRRDRKIGSKGTIPPGRARTRPMTESISPRMRGLGCST